MSERVELRVHERSLVIDHNDYGWQLHGARMMTPFMIDGPIRVERSAPGRPGRIVIEASDAVLDEVCHAMELAPCEAPPIHEIEQRLAKLEAMAPGKVITVAARPHDLLACTCPPSHWDNPCVESHDAGCPAKR